MPRAEDIMQPARATVHTEHPLSEARARLERFGAETLIVLDGDEVIGTLTRRQLDAAAGHETDAHPVCDYVSPVAAICALGDDIAQIRKIFQRDKHLSIVLVIDGRQCLKGIIPSEAVSGIGARQIRGTSDKSISPDPLGGHAPPARPGQLKVYTDLPHIEKRHIRK